MKFVCFSDTHGRHRQVQMPPGDVLIFAGDMVLYSIIEEIEAFDNYLSELPHKHKIVIAGNHDWPFQRQPAEARALMKHTVYLEDSEITIAKSASRRTKRAGRKTARPNNWQTSKSYAVARACIGPTLMRTCRSEIFSPASSEFSKEGPNDKRGSRS